MTRKQLTDWLQYFFLRIVICILQCMRIETCHWISQWMALLACDVIGLRRQVVDENLANSFPQLSPGQRHLMARKMWEHLFLMVCEIAHVQRKLHDTNWRDYVTFYRKADVVRYLLDVRPTVLVSGHFGNFEMASYLSGMFGFRTFAIARPLDNVYLREYVNRFRGSKGQYIVSKEGSAGFVADILKAGGTLSLLGDQNAGPKGCWVDFMGRPASCHKAVALFTLTSGAPMVVIACRRDRRPLQFVMGAEGIADPQSLRPDQASVPGLTSWYNQVLEEAIRSAPDQYWWVHRRWKGEPQKRKRKSTAAAA